jgi:hypothetical protein
VQKKEQKKRTDSKRASDDTVPQSVTASFMGLFTVAVDLAVAATGREY